jgi:hypothetical protein
MKCGTKNTDDAEFCKKCGTSLRGPKITKEREWDNRCEEECAGGGRGSPLFWGFIIILIGLWIIIEFVLKGMGLIHFDFPFCSIVFLIIGVLVILWGFRIIARR